MSAKFLKIFTKGLMWPFADMRLMSAWRESFFEAVSAHMLVFDNDRRANVHEPIKLADILVVHADTAIRNESAN